LWPVKTKKSQSSARTSTGRCTALCAPSSSTGTPMVAITHMSNVLGTVTPAEEIVRIAHAHGVPVLLDGAQSAVHRPDRVLAHRADHLAAALVGRKPVEPLLLAVEHADAGRPVDLVAGESRRSASARRWNS
jgi:hypothetical protein